MNLNAFKLEYENAWLKRIFTDLSLENAAFKDIFTKNSNAWLKGSMLYRFENEPFTIKLIKHAPLTLY